MRRTVLLAVLVYVLALFVRLLPLLYSGLPYNIDGFSLVNIAERTQDAGSLVPIANDPNLPNYKVPAFATLLTMFSDVLGVAPLALVQFLIPFLTSTAVLAGFTLVRRATKSDTAAGFAGIFLAFEGTFVFSTATAIKASLAFALLPVILHLYRTREDPRRRALAAFLLLFLPWIHHLSALVVFTMVSLLLVVDFVRWWREGRLTARRATEEIILGPLLLAPGLVHYHLVDLMYLRQVDDPRQIVLFLSVLLLAALLQLSLAQPAKLGPWLLGRRARRPWARIVDEKVLYPLGALALLILNAQGAVFAGTIRTKPAVLWAIAPLAVLAVFVIVGFNVVRHTDNRFRSLAMGLVLAPMAVMVFAFLRGLDPLSFALLYRSYAYMAFGLALCAGVGMAFLLARTKRRGVRGALATSFVVLVAATLPLGYGSADLYDVENATAPYEFQALTRLHGLGASHAGSDQRLFDVASWYYLQRGDGGLPNAIADGDLSAYDFGLVEDTWTTRGAQRHPLPNLVLGAGELSAALEANDVVYAIASGDAGLAILRVR